VENEPEFATGNPPTTNKNPPSINWGRKRRRHFLKARVAFKPNSPSAKRTTYWKKKLTLQLAR
jgi:hypothetical protein